MTDKEIILHLLKMVETQNTAHDKLMNMYIFAVNKLLEQKKNES